MKSLNIYINEGFFGNVNAGIGDVDSAIEWFKKIVEYSKNTNPAWMNMSVLKRREIFNQCPEGFGILNVKYNDPRRISALYVKTKRGDWNYYRMSKSDLNKHTISGTEFSLEVEYMADKLGWLHGDDFKSSLVYVDENNKTYLDIV